MASSYYYYRHCLLGSGCDAFHLDKTTKNCYIMPHNRMKNVHDFRDIMEESTSSNDTVFVLNCMTPQENVAKNNEAFTNTLSGTFVP